MLFSLLKHYLGLYISDTALKVSRSLDCFSISICHGVENCFSRLWGTDSDPDHSQNFMGSKLDQDPTFDFFS